MDRILAFGCHPDDVEFMAAGTLALLAEKGHEIHIATMAGGEVGHPTLSMQQIRECRLNESRESAKIIGATYHYAGGCDLQIEYSDQYRRMATAVVREVSPTIVLTHAPTDYLPDHEQTSLLVRNAAYIASVPNYDCGFPTVPMSGIPHLYHWNAFGLADILGRQLPLSCAVDISSVIETKAKMLAAHESQREWLAHSINWTDCVDDMKLQSAEEGKRAGFAYAEGFIQHVGSGHPKDNLLGQMLGDLCREFKVDASEL